MALRPSMSHPHWNSFLALDADAATLSRYIEFHKDNFTTYSLELARLLMNAAAEVDVAAKIACSRIASSSKCRSITEYRHMLTARYPHLPRYPIQIRRFGLKFKPWICWASGKSPKWWDAYNEGKHQRHLHFSAANLKNALNAVAAFFRARVLYRWIRPGRGRNAD